MTSPMVHSTASEGIGRLTLDHPPLNILSRAVLAELRAHMATLAAQSDLRVLVVDAVGSHFSAGADVAEHLPPECTSMIPEFLETVATLYEFPVPTIAAVQGKCLGGGCEVALAADLILAADTAVFGQPEILLGVLPPAACALLPGKASHNLAAELVLTGDAMDAQQLHTAGLVNRVVAPDDLGTATLDLAARIAKHSAAAVRAGKRMLTATGLGRSEALQRAGELYLQDLMTTHDAEEGLRAFLEKRNPVWTHD